MKGGLGVGLNQDAEPVLCLLAVSSGESASPGLLLPPCNSICEPGDFHGDQCPCLSIRKGTLPAPVRREEPGDLSASIQLQSSAVIIPVHLNLKPDI